MEEMNFKRIKYDYFSNTSSYVKQILDMLPEEKVSVQKKQVIKELYNYFLSRFNDEKIREIITISSLFSEKVSISNYEITARDIEYIYLNFLNQIVFDSANRDKIFDIMNESMKVYVGYYNTLINNEYYDNENAYIR